MLADIRAAMARDARLTADVGWNKNGVGQQFPIYAAGGALTPGGFGQNPAVLATARDENIPVIRAMMNNNAFGAIARLQKAHYGLTYGATFPNDDGEQSPNDAAIAEGYGVKGVRFRSAAEFRPAQEAAIRSNKPTVIDVAMINTPTPTSGHWNILDIYSPGKHVSHVAVD